MNTSELFERGYLPNIQKIAVLRANALGDFLFTLPALEALRSSYPTAEIVLLGKQWHADFLRNRPGPIDRVLVVPICRGVGSEDDVLEDPQALEAFFLAMNEEHFDLACQLHGGGRYSNPFIQHLGARLTIGLKTSDAMALDRWTPYVYFQHEILRYLEVVSLVGARTNQLEPHVIVTKNDYQEVEQFISFDNSAPLVVLHPGASDPRRRWPAENFAEIGDFLAQHGMRIVLTGTKSEQELTRLIHTTMHAPALDLVGKISLGGLAALLSHCRLVVSNDTGPLHLSNAVGTPSVGIFWCFNLVTAAPLLRARHRPVSSWELNCPVCGTDNARSHCEHKVSFVADITLGEVKAAIMELLDS